MTGSGFLKRLLILSIIIFIIIIGVEAYIIFHANRAEMNYKPERIIRRGKIELGKDTGTEGDKSLDSTILKEDKKERAASVKISINTSSGRDDAQIKKKGAKNIEREAPVISRRWVLNIASYTSRKEVENLAKRVAAAGYHAYITEIDLGGVHWYRLRVGFYPSRELAKDYSKELSKRFGIKDIWIVRPDDEEIIANAEKAGGKSLEVKDKMK